MSNNADYYNNLIKTSQEAVAQLNSNMDLVKKLMADVVEGAPEQDKARVKELQTLTNDAINLAKKGDTSGINELIKRFSDGGKSSK